MKHLFLFILLFSAITSCNSQEKPAVADNTLSKSDVVIENILNRRSVRKYQPQQVSKDTIDIIMNCAVNAPSALNKQPWEIRVIQNKEILKKIEGLGAKFHGAPTLIVIGKDKENSYASFDCGLLTQTILLTAESMDLGTCSLGSVAAILNQEAAKDVFETLGLPDNYDAVLAIALGYKAERPDAKPRDSSKVKYID